MVVRNSAIRSDPFLSSESNLTSALSISVCHFRNILGRALLIHALPTF